MADCFTVSDTYCIRCPRRCGKRRGAESGEGFCAQGYLPRIALALPHFGEEPCISGSRGAGAVFFTGCNLRCAFCQNAAISAGGRGRTVSVERLREIFFELKAKGVHNIDLVTPSHFTDAILAALEGGVGLPIVWNSGGYDSVDELRRLEGAVNVYMPDMKYTDAVLAARLSRAPDYPETAKAAITEMYRQTGPFELDGEGVMRRGVIIRHLVLPGHLDNSFDVIDWVASAFPRGSVMLSLMSQYTPHGETGGFPELSRRLTKAEQRRVVEYLDASGIVSGYRQELSSATDELLPEFDLRGV